MKYAHSMLSFGVVAWLSAHSSACLSVVHYRAVVCIAPAQLSPSYLFGMHPAILRISTSPYPSLSLSPALLYSLFFYATDSCYT